MPWQDIVISVGQWIFIVSMIPSIIGKDKPALLTSSITGTVLFVYAFAFSTLSLWMSVVPTIILACLWLTLAWQKYFEKTRSN